jgi:tryptophan synthase alpha chain
MAAQCTIVVERLTNGQFRATSGLFPDCEAVARSEEEARAAVETAIERCLQERATGSRDRVNPIDALFQRLHANNRKAFIPFVTAGDPDLAVTETLVRELATRGAHLIEIGFPYSDPIADGAVIQASYTRALARGLRLDDIFALVRRLADSSLKVPLVAMVSYSLVFHRGPGAFLTDAEAAGFSGAIIPDLPLEESRVLAPLAAQRDFKLIQLVTPTTSRDRAAQIARASTGFLYCVSVTGITGERDTLPQDLLAQLAWLRTQTELPLCVGFGISKPEHVRMLRDAADGVIVGSALVRRLEDVGRRAPREVIEEIGALASGLARALNPGDP